MRLHKWIVLTWCCLSLITSAVIIIGRGQPPSNGLALLQLDACELPCWLGITPGQTPWDEAKQMIMDAYSGEQYTAQFTDASHAEILINGTANSLLIEIAPLSFNYADSLVNRIVLTTNFNYFGEYMVSIGDFIAFVGLPSDILLSNIGTSAGVALLYKDEQVQVQSVPYIRCNLASTRITTKITTGISATSVIAIYKHPEDYEFFSGPTPWRGFNHCYELR